jgi:hypothetical protein
MIVSAHADKANAPVFSFLITAVSCAFVLAPDFMHFAIVGHGFKECPFNVVLWCAIDSWRIFKWHQFGCSFTSQSFAYNFGFV